MPLNNLPAEVDRDKLAETALVLLSLTLHEGGRVWKGLERDLMDLLIEKGWVVAHRSKAKSVVLTEDGERLAPELLRQHFGGRGLSGDSLTVGGSPRASSPMVHRSSDRQWHHASTHVEGEPRSGVVLYAKDVNRVAAFYTAVLGVQASSREENHVVLESPSCQLVILSIPEEIASSIEITVPPTRRADAAIKPVYVVPSIAAVRAAAEAFGGVLNASANEWLFQGFNVCDGLDPEGNVIQFREANPRLHPSAAAPRPIGE